MIAHAVAMPCAHACDATALGDTDSTSGRRGMAGKPSLSLATCKRHGCLTPLGVRQPRRLQVARLSDGLPAIRRARRSGQYHQALWHRRHAHLTHMHGLRGVGMCEYANMLWDVCARRLCHDTHTCVRDVHVCDATVLGLNGRAHRGRQAHCSLTEGDTNRALDLVLCKHAVGCLRTETTTMLAHAVS